MTLFQPYYVVTVGLGVLIAVFFPVTKQIREKALRRDYWRLQFLVLIGAVLGAKLSVLMVDNHWPWQPMKDWTVILYSGRSITGALLLGFLTAEIAKPLLKYEMPPNDRFAAVIPFSIGLGRFGCALTGCCRGIPHDGLCSMVYADGIPRYPTQLYEALFQFAVGVMFIYFVRNRILFGRVFSFYLVLYGAFRFFIEMIRDTPKDVWGYSGYQWISCLLVFAGMAFLVKRTISVPDAWKKYSETQNQKTIVQSQTLTNGGEL